MVGVCVKLSNKFVGYKMINNLKELIKNNYSDVYNTEEKLENILKLVDNLDDDFKTYLIDLLNNQDTQNIEVEGFTVERLQNEHGMNLVASVLTLDYLERDPENALKSLSKGHDEINY